MGPRYRAAGSLKSLKMVHLEGVLGDEFVGLVLAFSDAHEPEHPRRRGTAPCASRSREGHRRRAPGRRDHFALNRGSAGPVLGRAKPRTSGWRRCALLASDNPPVLRVSRTSCPPSPYKAGRANQGRWASVAL